MSHTIRPGVLVQPAGRLRRVFVLLLLGAFTSVLVLVNTLRPWPPVSPSSLAANLRSVSSSFSSSASGQSDDPTDQSNDSSSELFTLFSSKPSKPFLFAGQSQHFLPLSNHRRLLAQRNVHLLSLLHECAVDNGWLQPLLDKLNSQSSNEQMEQLLLQLSRFILSGHQLASCFDRWQTVSGSTNLFQVFSAYIDLRQSEQRVVKIVATTKTRSKPIFYCVHWLPLISCANCSSIVLANLQGRSYLTLGAARAIRENWSLPYSAFYLQCPLPAHLPLPLAVSVLVGAGPTMENSGWPRALHPLNNLLLIANHLRLQPASWFDQTPQKSIINNQTILSPSPITSSRSISPLNQTRIKVPPLSDPKSIDIRSWLPKSDQEQTHSGHLAVCVKPIHYEYDQLGRLIEFLSFNRLLGVTHFVLYIQSMGPHVRCLLKQQPKQLVTLLPWQGLRPRSQTEIRTQNLFAALNDCSMRLVGRFRYVAMIDLDEFIIPRMDASLIQMMQRLHAMDRQRPAAGAYSFQNAFFYLGWPNDDLFPMPSDHQSKSANVVVPSNHQFVQNDKINVGQKSIRQQSSIQSIVLSKTQRRSDLHPHRQRSKLIVRPDALLEVGNHFVWQFVNGFGAVHVHSRAALLHHYRVCEFGGLECLQSSSVQDRRTHYWANSLNTAIHDLHSNYSQVCSSLDQKIANA